MIYLKATIRKSTMSDIVPCAHIDRLGVENKLEEKALSKSDQDNFSKESANEVPKEHPNIENVTVKLRISDTQTIARVYSNQLTIGDVRKDIAGKFEVREEFLSLGNCGRNMCDSCLLVETEPNEFGIREYTLLLNNPGSEYNDENSMPKLDLNIYYNKCRLPDFITVHIMDEHGHSKNLVVEIQNKAIVKPFLCGYRDKFTGIEYLDAFTQTGPYFDKWKNRRCCSRDTQTVVHKQKLVNTMHDQTSQCFLDENNVVFVSDCTDISILPKKYQTYAQKINLENKIGKILLIQRNWRRYLAVRYMKNAAIEYRRLVSNRIAEEEDFKLNLMKRSADEERAKNSPRTKDDFDLLYSEVHRWKLSELKRISSLYEGAPRIAEMNLLLDKEIQILNGIDRRRHLANQNIQYALNEKQLKKMGKPIKWIGYKDRIIHMDLKRTQRVRCLYDIYSDMKKPLEKAERLELLGKVKEVLVAEQEFPEFPKLFNLIERERNMLIYTKHCNLEILRQRELILFTELIRFNKEETSEKVARRLCSVCHKVKSYELFALWTRQNSVDICKKCQQLVSASTENVIYNAILRAIQREERKKRCNSSYAFILQVDDIRYILECIWHNHSIMSKTEDLVSLRLPRWIKSDDWSPWNCICLTELEARDHYKINDLRAVYDHNIILEIENRHKLARAAFHKLAAVSTEFVESRQWWRVGVNKQRQAEPSKIE